MMGTRRTPDRFRRGICADAAHAFAVIVASSAATRIDQAVASARQRFSATAYDVDWPTSEKYAWLFVTALEDADEPQKMYWLGYVEGCVAEHLDVAQVTAA